MSFILLSKGFMVLISERRFSQDNVGTRDATESSGRGGRHTQLPLGSIGQMLKVGSGSGGDHDDGDGGGGVGGDTHVIVYTLMTIITISIEPQPSARTPPSPLAFNPSGTGRCAASRFSSGIQGAACDVIRLTHAKQYAEPLGLRTGQQQSSTNCHYSGCPAAPTAAPPLPPPPSIYRPFLWTCRSLLTQNNSRLNPLFFSKPLI